MKNDEEDNEWSWFESQHILNYEDVVVEHDEAHNSYKVGVA